MCMAYVRIKYRFPFISQDVKTDLAFNIDIWMKYLPTRICREPNEASKSRNLKQVCISIDTWIKTCAYTHALTINPTKHLNLKLNASSKNILYISILGFKKGTHIHKLTHTRTLIQSWESYPCTPVCKDSFLCMTSRRKIFDCTRKCTDCSFYQSVDPPTTHT